MDRTWSASALADFLRRIELLYDWDVMCDESYGPKSGRTLDTQLAYVSDGVSAHHQRKFLLQVPYLTYSSPTIAMFQGLAAGLNGLADFIEKLIFLRESRALKRLEVQNAQLDLLERKFELVTKAMDVVDQTNNEMEGFNVSPILSAEYRRLHRLALEDLLNAVNDGVLTRSRYRHLPDISDKDEPAKDAKRDMIEELLRSEEDNRFKI